MHASLVLSELSFFTGRRGVCLWGGPEFFGMLKGGGISFFSVGQREEGPEFLRFKEGGPKFSSNFFCANQIFSQPPGQLLFNLITAPSIFYVRGMFFHLGGPKFV